MQTMLIMNLLCSLEYMKLFKLLVRSPKLNSVLLGYIYMAAIEQAIRCFHLYYYSVMSAKTKYEFYTEYIVKFHETKFTFR